MVQISSRLTQTCFSFLIRLPDETSTELQNRFQDSESRKQGDTAGTHWFSPSHCREHSRLNACNIQELPGKVLMYQRWNVMKCIYFTVLEYFHFMLISVFYFTAFQRQQLCFLLYFKSFASRSVNTNSFIDDIRDQPEPYWLLFPIHVDLKYFN